MLATMPRRPPSDKPPHPLRQWRERRGLSQEQLADMTGWTQGMMSHLERYFRIPLGDALGALLAQTGLPTDALIRPQRFLAEYPDFLHKPRRPRKLGTFFFHWDTPALWQIEAEAGFRLEDLLLALGRLELKGLGDVKHGDVPREEP